MPKAQMPKGALGGVVTPSSRGAPPVPAEGWPHAAEGAVPVPVPVPLPLPVPVPVPVPVPLPSRLAGSGAIPERRRRPRAPCACAYIDHVTQSASGHVFPPRVAASGAGSGSGSSSAPGCSASRGWGPRWTRRSSGGRCAATCSPPSAISSSTSHCCGSVSDRECRPWGVPGPSPRGVPGRVSVPCRSRRGTGGRGRCLGRAWGVGGAAQTRGSLG